MAEPTPTDLVRQLRETLGMFAGAMPITPQAAWEEALQKVTQLKQGMCWACQQREYPTAWESQQYDGPGGSNA